MEIGSKNRELEKSKVASSQTCFIVALFIRSKKADNNGILLDLLMFELSLFTNKTKFKDLSQFWQNKNQYCTVSCVCNFARNSKIYLCATARAWKMQLNEGTLIMYSNSRPSIV